MYNQIQKIISDYQAKPLGNQRHFAVLLPLIEVEGETHILYEVRASHISQAGETSFPGGAVEQGETYRQAAVRETTEELRIPANQIEVYGEIDYIVSEWAVIRCFVGRLHGIDLEDIQYNEEVERLYSVPLKFLLDNDPTPHELATETILDENFPYELITHGKDYKFRQAKQRVLFYDLPEEILWGFTASMTFRFIDIVRRDYQKK